MEGGLDFPAAEIYFCNLECIGDFNRKISQQNDYRLVISRGMEQLNFNPPQLQRLAVIGRQSHRALIDPPPLGVADPLTFTADRTNDILVMANHEGSITFSKHVHELVRAEVAIGHPQIVGFDRFDHFIERTSFLSVSVFDREHILNRSAAWIEHHERFPRQSRSPFRPQFLEAMLGTAEMDTIEDLGAIPCDIATAPHMHLVTDLARLLV